MSGFIIFVVILLAYFLPYIVARKRNSRNKNQVLVINFFFGFTGIGYIVALVMALSPDVEVKK